MRFDHEVTAQVKAHVGTVYVALLPPRAVGEPGDSTDLPWAWCAMCRVTFRIGKAQVSKVIRARYQYPDHWVDLSEEDRADGKRKLIHEVCWGLGRHGITPGVLDVKESNPPPPTDAPGDLW